MQGLKNVVMLNLGCTTSRCYLESLKCTENYETQTLIAGGYSCPNGLYFTHESLYILILNIASYTK